MEIFRDIGAAGNAIATTPACAPNRTADGIESFAKAVERFSNMK
ncbi:hypothetical protein [Raoultibacter timonensis]|nr:hypothetical protein [Raoultibacter timonensis]